MPASRWVAPSRLTSRVAAIPPISSLASNLVVHANNRNFASALVSLDPDALNAFAKEHNLSGDYAALSQAPEVRAQIQTDIDQLNEGLNRWETIKKFTILDRDLTEEAGELTASLKLKRKVVSEKYQDQLDAHYSS